MLSLWTEYRGCKDQLDGERVMSQLDAKKRARLPNSAFAYVDSQGRRRLPINDESHVRNALARFNQVVVRGRRGAGAGAQESCSRRPRSTGSCRSGS